jgi:predicted PurR-regulated permease PerM
MTAVLAGAAAGGFVGALLANPLLAIAKAFFNEYQQRTVLGLPRGGGAETVEEVRDGDSDA